MFVIKGFSDKATQKLFLGVALNQKERRAFGAMNVQKAAERLTRIPASQRGASPSPGKMTKRPMSA